MAKKKCPFVICLVKYVKLSSLTRGLDKIVDVIDNTSGDWDVSWGDSQFTLIGGDQLIYNIERLADNLADIGKELSRLKGRIQLLPKGVRINLER